MKNDDLTLIVWQSLKCQSQAPLGRVVPLRRIKPEGIYFKRSVPTPEFCVIQDRIAHTPEQKRLLVGGSANAAALD